VVRLRVGAREGGRLQRDRAGPDGGVAASGMKRAAGAACAAAQTRQVPSTGCVAVGAATEANAAVATCRSPGQHAAAAREPCECVSPRATKAQR
jgi:hypothetical protein